MNFKANIIDSSCNSLTKIVFHKNNSLNLKIKKFKKIIETNIEVKNKCIFNDNIIILMKDTNIVYINYIYLIHNNLIFSNHEIINNPFNNKNETYLLVLINIQKNINIYDINKIFHKKIYSKFYYQDKCDYIDNFIESISKNLDNYFIASYLVNINGYFLKYLSNDLKNNKEIVLLAVKNSEHSFQYASNDLLNS